ncbi:hypothetical protein [Rhodococcus sp. NPDC049939]|uniref:hypothetical protein n=1 Tax=Rhodococcus sp. NPDC049939 TaxID=3155511 RepID=UPI0033D8BBD2
MRLEGWNSIPKEYGAHFDLPSAAAIGRAALNMTEAAATDRPIVPALRSRRPSPRAGAWFAGQANLS